MKKFLPLLLCLSAFFYVPGLSAQTQPEISALQQVIECAESYLGPHDLLLNGKPYFSLHPQAKKHPYLVDSKWTTGVIYIKGNVFEVSDIKYNIERDRIILKTQYDDGRNALTELNPTLVDSFRIHGHTFINIATPPQVKSFFGYAEKIYAGKIYFYRKHQKSFLPTYNNTTPQGSYSESDYSFYIGTPDSLTLLSDKRDFLNYFGENKKLVNKFMNQQKIQLNKSNKEILHILLNYCDGL